MSHILTRPNRFVGRWWLGVYKCCSSSTCRPTDETVQDRRLHHEVVLWDGTLHGIQPPVGGQSQCQWQPEEPQPVCESYLVLPADLEVQGNQSHCPTLRGLERALWWDQNRTCDLPVWVLKRGDGITLHGIADSQFLRMQQTAISKNHFTEGDHVPDTEIDWVRCTHIIVQLIHKDHFYYTILHFYIIENHNLLMFVKVICVAINGTIPFKFKIHF